MNDASFDHHVLWAYSVAKYLRGSQKTVSVKYARKQLEYSVTFFRSVVCIIDISISYLDWKAYCKHSTYYCCCSSLAGHEDGAPALEVVGERPFFVRWMKMEKGSSSCCCWPALLSRSRHPKYLGLSKGPLGNIPHYLVWASTTRLLRLVQNVLRRVCTTFSTSE